MSYLKEPLNLTTQCRDFKDVKNKNGRVLELFGNFSF
jgi:hypothetical protein